MVREAGDSILTPFGSRIFTMQDWVVRIKTVEGQVIWKGVQPEVSEERAVDVACRSTYLPKSMIQDVQIMRRSERSKVQG